jgi:hypothetical protein
LHHVEQLDHRFGLVGLQVTDEVLAGAGEPGELLLGFLKVVFGDVAQTGGDRRANDLDRLLLADADERDAPGGPPAGAQLIIDELLDSVKLAPYFVDVVRSGTTVTSVRGPGRVAQ